MTTEDTQAQQAPPPPPRSYPPVSELRRSRTDRKVAGVSGGLGRYAGVDPLIFRILFVVLTFFGGSGLLLYALAWLLVPADGELESEGQRLLHGRSTSSVSKVIAVVVVIILGLAAVGALLDTGPGLGGLGALVVIAVLVVLLLRNGQRPGASQSPYTPPYGPTYGPVPPPEPGEFGQTPGTAYAATSPAYVPPGPPPWTAPTQPVPPLPPKPPKERSVLGRVTVSVALILVGLMVAWNSAADDDFKVLSIFGASLAVVAAGLLVGAFVGRARGLIVLAIVLSLATLISAAADRDFSGGVGERTWVPTTAEEAERPFRLGIGDAQLDLTKLPAGSTVDVVARLGVGEMRVIVPTDARVVVDGDVGAGTLTLLDRKTLDGTDLHDSATGTEPAGAPQSGTLITLDAEVGLGELEVRR